MAQPSTPTRQPGLLDRVEALEIAVAKLQSELDSHAAAREKELQEKYQRQYQKALSRKAKEDQEP